MAISHFVHTWFKDSAKEILPDTRSFVAKPCSLLVVSTVGNTSQCIGLLGGRRWFVHAKCSDCVSSNHVKRPKCTSSLSEHLQTRDVHVVSVRKEK